MANFLTSSSIVQDLILPFVLVFVLLFAILEKSELLGKEKKQINAIIAFAIALLFVAFSNYVTMVKQFSIVLVISLVVIFVFLLIWGFVWGEKTGDPLKEATALKWVIGLIGFIVVIVATLVITGYWDKIPTNSELVSNVVFIIIIIAAIATVLSSGAKKEKKD